MKLYVVGTGPGSVSHMSNRAVQVIEQVDCIAGYTTYVARSEERRVWKECRQ